jgi:hypothetical protein
MEHYLEIGLRFWNEFSSWSPPRTVLYTIVAFGILSSWIMTRFVSAAPLFAAPIVFIVLSFAAMVSNFVARTYVMMGTTDLQKALLFTCLGHALAGVVLLALFKVSEKGAGR